MRYRLLTIALVALALRLGYAAATGALRHPQHWEQEQLATHLLVEHAFLYRHAGVTFRSYAEPLYPFLAAAVYLATDHSQTALVLVQLVIGAATAWVTGRAALLATGDAAAAIVTASLVAIHPGFIAYDCVLHPLVLDAFFVVAAGAALLRYRQLPAVGRGLLAAVVIGLGALTRPTILLFLLPLGWTAWRSAPTAVQRLGRATLVTVAALAVLAPWTVRNAVVQHTFMLTRSGTGLVFWLGNNAASTGSATDRWGRPLVDGAPPALRARLAGAGEVPRDRLYAQAAWDYVRADPAAAVGRFLRRLGYFWWFSPQWGAAWPAPLRVAYRLWWAALLLLMAVGVAVSRRRPRRWGVWLLAAMALLISLAQCVFYVEGRHRLAVEPLVLPLAALGALAVRRQHRAPLAE